MTYVMTDHLCHPVEISYPAEAGQHYDRATEKILPHGRSSQSLFFGRTDGVHELRVDVDPDVGRAAVRWLSDGTHGVELEPDGPIVVMWSVDDALETVPAELARVSTATARRAVTEYVATGKRPRCVEWVSGG